MTIVIPVTYADIVFPVFREIMQTINRAVSTAQYA